MISGLSVGKSLGASSFVTTLPTEVSKIGTVVSGRILLTIGNPLLESALSVVTGGD